MFFEKGCAGLVCASEKRGVSEVEVYFDDFSVEHTKSPVVQADDYYPFGLTFNSNQREGSLKNKRLYNQGAELQGDLELNVYETYFRVLDPALGRWWQVDPKPNEAFTIYSAMDNNPIRLNDPLGDTSKVNLFDKVFDDKMLHESADNSVENESDDGVFLVFGHGNPQVVQYTDNEGRLLHARTGKEFNAMMSEKSPAFKKALAENKSITVHLNACNVASQEYLASNGKVYKDNSPIAKDISKNLPKGSKLIAPNGYVLFNGKRGYRKVLESNTKFLNTGKGSFLTLVDGKVISKQAAPYEKLLKWQQVKRKPKPKPKEE